MSTKKKPPAVRRTTGQKEHRFILVVKTDRTRRAAESAVLASFAGRQPDGCEFHLRGIAGDKEAWMAGAKSGSDVTFDLVMRALGNLRKTCRLRSRKN